MWRILHQVIRKGQLALERWVPELAVDVMRVIGMEGCWQIGRSSESMCIKRLRAEAMRRGPRRVHARLRYILGARQRTMPSAVGMLVKPWISHSSRSIRNKCAIVPIRSIRASALASRSCRPKILEWRLQKGGLTWGIIMLHCVIMLLWHLIQDRVHDRERTGRLLVL